MTSTRILVTPLLLSLAFSACDKGSQPAPETPAAAAESGDAAVPATTDDAAADSGGDEVASTEPGAPDVPWSEKSFKQRQEFMGIVFLKEQKKLFQAHDETGFKTFKCQTCHGDNMKEVNFKMPSDSIYPLPTKDTIKAAMEYDEKITKFMMEQVVPESAKLLGMEPYNPETGQGFSCFGCHPTE